MRWQCRAEAYAAIWSSHCRVAVAGLGAAKANTVGEAGGQHNALCSEFDGSGGGRLARLKQAVVVGRVRASAAGETSLACVVGNALHHRLRQQVAAAIHGKAEQRAVETIAGERLRACEGDASLAAGGDESELLEGNAGRRPRQPQAHLRQLSLATRGEAAATELGPRHTAAFDKQHPEAASCGSQAAGRRGRPSAHDHHLPVTGSGLRRAEGSATDRRFARNGGSVHDDGCGLIQEMTTRAGQDGVMEGSGRPA